MMFSISFEKKANYICQVFPIIYDLYWLLKWIPIEPEKKGIRDVLKAPVKTGME